MVTLCRIRKPLVEFMIPDPVLRFQSRFEDYRLDAEIA
jgi:hypothetical protein